jgi:hypothetical protein
MTSNPTPADRTLWQNAHDRYLRDVAHIASRLREMADDVERRGRQYGSPLFSQRIYGDPAGHVVSTATGIHNLHLGDIVRDAATAEQLYDPSFGDPGAQPTETQ